MTFAPPLATARIAPGEDPIVYAVVLGYLALLVGLGWAFKHFSRDTDDYFRSGCRGTWWLVGVSIYVSNMSAWTFTGGAGQAFEWGWSILFNYWPIGVGMLLCAVWFAPWFRQMRVTTAPEAIGLRFDELTRQIFGWKNLIGSPLLSAVHLYGLAIFAATVLGFRLEFVILGIGLAVSLYATAGGRFALLAADFIQAAIIIPTALLIAWLCLQQFGGLGGFFAAIEQAGLAERYALFKGSVRPESGTYSPLWIAAALLFFMVMNNVNVVQAPRFFTVKDSVAARKSALLAAGLIFAGSTIWFIPPITARLLYDTQVAAVPLGNPAESSYAIAALNLLPNGLVGVLMVAIFAATTGAMDGALNINAGIVVRDVYPAWCRWRGRAPASEARQLSASRVLTVVFGALVVAIALGYSQLRGLTLFDLIMNVLALTGLPFEVPLFWGLFVRRVPRWAALFSGVVTMIPAVVFFFDTTLLGTRIPWETRILGQFAIGSIAFLGTRLFWSRVNAADRAHIEAFFVRMHRPVDFEREVGHASDFKQLQIVGIFTAAIGLGVGLLYLVPDEPANRLVILKLAAAYLGFGGLLALLGTRGRVAPSLAASSRSAS